MSVSSFATASAGLQPYEQTFTSSGTWTKPNGVKTVEVLCVGGGANQTNGGAGGYYKGFFDVSASSSVAVTVGAGGGASSFGSYIASNGSSDYSAGKFYFPSISGNAYIATPTTQTMSGTPYNDGRPYQQSEDGTYSISWVIQYNSSPDLYSMYAYKSTDGGVTWNGTGGWYATQTSYSPKPISHGQANGLWVMWADYTNYYTSTDGTSSTWVKRNYPIAGTRVSGMNYANGKWWIFFSSNGSTTTNIAWSTDCINWSTSAVTFVGDSNKDLKNIVFWNGYYWAAGLSGSSILGFYSTDGITWTRQAYQNGDAPNTNQFELWATPDGVIGFPLGNGTTVKWTSPTTGSSVACGKYAFSATHKDGIIAIDDSSYAISMSSTASPATWSVYGSNGYNSQNVGIAGGKVCGNYYNGSVHTLIKFAGYAGQPGTYLGSAYGGAGAGGHGAPGAQSFAGPGIDGYCVGGNANFAVSASYGGGGNSTANGGPGIVKVRWWA